MALRTIIVDDDSVSAQLLEKMLTAFSSIEVISSARTLKEGILQIQRFGPDLVFLDIQLQSENGLDLFSMLSPIEFQVIVTSGYDYAIQAIKKDVTDYLLKPFCVDELRASVERAESKIRHQPTRPATLMDDKIDPKGFRIGVPGKNGTLFLKVSEIIRCEGLVNYTRIFLSSGEMITSSRTLSEFEKRLTRFNFFRIHKSHLVNLEFVHEISRGKSPYVTLSDNISLQVSRRHKESLINRLTRTFEDDAMPYV